MNAKQPLKRGIGVGDASHKGGSSYERELDDADWDKLARGPRRWPRRLAVFLILVTVVVALLPMLVAKTPLRNVLLSAVLPKNSVQVTIGDASLGWFSPPSVSGMEVRDVAGRPLAAVESVQLSRSPWSLATNWHDLGEIDVTRPVVYVAVRPDGSNIEDAINELASKAGVQSANDSSSGRAQEKVAVAVKLVDGSVLVQDAATGRGWRLASLNAQFDSHGPGVGQIAASGQIMTEAATAGVASPIATAPAGKFAVSLTTDANGRQQAQWQADSITLAAAEPWLRRFVRGAELNGVLSGQGTAAWSSLAGGQSAKPQAAMLPSDLVTAGSLRIDRLDASAAMLGGDRVRLAMVELPWRLMSQPSGINVEDLQLQSDVGRVAVRGVVDPSLLSTAAIAGVTTAPAIDAAAQHNLEIRGELDLPKLAAMLPHALAIREGTTIDSGTIQLAIRNQPEGGGQTLSGQIRTEKLAGTSGGKALSWDQPVSATFELRRDNGSVRLNSLKCDSEFLKIDASGTTQQLTASAEFDLNKLAAQLGQFIDLSGAQLGGTGTAHLDCQLADANQFTAALNSELSQLRVAMGSEAPLTEPRLSLKAEAAGVLDPASHQPARVATARLQVDADSDLLDAQLAGPVDCTAAAPTWPLSIRVTGSIAHWLTLSRPWIAMDPWQVDGQSQATADIRAVGTTVDVANAKATVTNLKIVGVGWHIAEPRVELAADLHWNRATNEVASQSAQLVSSAVALATKDVHVKTGGTGPPQVTGVAAFRADVARLASWQVPPTQPAPYQPQGMITGNVRVVQQADRITGELTATGQNLVLAQWMAAGAGAGRAAGYQTIWQEPQVTIRGATTYDGTADHLAFQQLQVQSNTLQAAADGQIDKLTTLADVTAAGTLNYDLAQITPLLKPYVGDGVQLAGRETARFQIAGRLGGAPGAVIQSAGYAGQATNPSALHWSRRLSARVEVPWDSANVYGLPVGGGKIAAALGEGALRIDPLALAVAEGQLNAAPNVQFDPEPMLLTLPKGPVLTNVKISPEVSEAMLKYIAPVLAGATQSEGQFSLQLDGARVPLLDTKKTDASGQMTVHSVRVVPGPMAKQWVDLAQQIQSLVKRTDATAAQGRQITLLTIQDQQVNFKVADGRVYHQGMEFQIGDLTCHSEGSVGLDETVAITLRLAIPDKWVEGQPLLAGLKGQQLAIPIGGTLARPQMDQRAVASLSKQLIQGAAQQAVGGELDKALGKFFKQK
jgi:translocation and assembly module TamB